MEKGKKRSVVSLLAIVSAVCLSFGAIFLSASAEGTGKSTKTWTVDTSFRTRVTTELSKPTEFKGGTIEFDLLFSDLKDDYNIEGICAETGNYEVGVAYQDFNIAQDKLYSVRRLNYASINFNFHKVNEDMDEFSWRVGGANGTDEMKMNESQLSSFSYYADGRIVEFSGDMGDSTIRYQREIGPGDDGFVGTQADVDAFMTPGYSYRVEWVWGTVSEDKIVTVNTPEEMNALGVNDRNGWYVVYRKAMSAPEEAYEVLFAFRTRAVYRLQNAVNDNKLGGYAGFEISANCGNPRQYNNGEYSPASHNVKMELDNVAIYEGYSFEEGTTKGFKTDFEGAYAGLTGLDESGIKNAGRKASDMGAWAGDFSREYWDEHEANVDGLRVQIVNAGRECIESFATSELTERDVVTVSYSDGTDVLLKQEVVSGFAATLPNEKIDGVFYRWDTDGKDIECVQSDIMIVGVPTENRYIIYDASGGEGSVPLTEGKVGSMVTLSDGAGFSKEAHRLVGWATREGGEAVYPLSGEYEVSEKDVTLYAVWELLSYRVDFTLADGTVLASTQVVHGQNAFYRGEIPVEEGKVFVGWNEDVNEITQEKVLVAEFDNTYDEFADNKVADIVLSSEKEEELKFYRTFGEDNGISIRLDIVSVSGMKQVCFVRESFDGTQKVEANISDYVKDYTTVLLECDQWSYTVFTKALDQSDDEFTLREKGDILQTFEESYAGITFHTTGEFLLSLNEISIRGGGDVYRNVMRWEDAVLSEGEEKIFGGLIAVQATAPASLSVKDCPREYTVTFKDAISGEILSERHCFAGGKATAPTVEGYSYDFSDVENVTENREVVGNGTKEWYTVVFSADGYVFEDIRFYCGEKVILPSATDTAVSYWQIVGWAREKNVLIPEYAAGEEVIIAAGNYTLYPVWGIQTHTVTFTDDDGVILCVTKVLHGATASYTGTVPEKEGFVFDGWDTYPSSVMEDMVVKAIYKESEAKKYPVIVTDGSGSGMYTAGESVVIVAEEIEGYTFSHWETESGVQLVSQEGGYAFTMPEGEVMIKAVYTERTTFVGLLGNYVLVWVVGGIFLLTAGAAVIVFVKRRKGGR